MKVVCKGYIQVIKWFSVCFLLLFITHVSGWEGTSNISQMGSLDNIWIFCFVHPKLLYAVSCLNLPSTVLGCWDFFFGFYSFF